MATEFRVTEIKTIIGTNYLYLIIEFYVNNDLTHTEDFIIGRPPERRFYTGSIGPDGEFLDPEAFDTEPLNILQEIIDVITEFEASHRGDDLLTGAQTRRTTRIKTDASDPLGFIARGEVQAIIGQKIVIL